MFVLAGIYASSKQFPDNFLLGTATSAYQVEGAWDEGENIYIYILLVNQYVVNINTLLVKATYFNKIRAKVIYNVL